jgi:hypothetical protein
MPRSHRTNRKSHQTSSIDKTGGRASFHFALDRFPGVGPRFDFKPGRNHLTITFASEVYREPSVSAFHHPTTTTRRNRALSRKPKSCRSLSQKTRPIEITTAPVSSRDTAKREHRTFSRTRHRCRCEEWRPIGMPSQSHRTRSRPGKIGIERLPCVSHLSGLRGKSEIQLQLTCVFSRKCAGLRRRPARQERRRD